MLLALPVLPLLKGRAALLLPADADGSVRVL
jgi:hypothetical protein